MPPKKQEQQLTNPYIPFYVLPIFLIDGVEQSDAQKIIRQKNINIKKAIDKNKIIDILKQKGLAQYLTPQGQIKPEGRKFICENIKTVLQQFTAEISKPADSKSVPAAKIAKKGISKQEPPAQQNKQPIIELNMEKKCNDFHFLLDFPQNSDELKACIENGMKIDAVMVIQEKTKKGSNIPNYDLLGKSYQQSDLMSNLNQTKIKDVQKMPKGNQHQRQHQISRTKSRKSMLKTLKSLKSSNPEFSNLIITEVPFEKDLSHPQNNEMNFINSTFKNLTQITVEKQKYQKWIKNDVKKIPMIQPLKEIIKKQVLIENQDKKGKKDANKQPEFQTVEQVIQTKYQSFSENIKSNLNIYKQISSSIQVSKTLNSTQNLLKNLLLSVELQLGKQSSLNGQINPQKLIQMFVSKPLAKANFIDSLKKNLRQVQSFSRKQLNHNLIYPSQQIQEKVNLMQIFHKEPSNKQVLEFQFIMKIFTNFMQKQQSKLRWNFSDRIYRQKLTKSQVLSQIQNQLLRDPKIYQGLLRQDNIKFLCMAKINPPGRVLYSNDIFKSKVIPDFQNWLKNFKQKSPNEASEFFDYIFEDAGNLSIKRQRLTPTDNVIICDEKVTIGNSLFKVNNFQKYDTFYGIKQINSNTNQFWLSNTQSKVTLSIFQKQHKFIKTAKIQQNIQVQGSSEVQTVQKIIQTIQNHKRVEMWFRTQQFILSHTPYPTIQWLSPNKRSFSGQAKRQFGPKGEITSYLNDGSVKIFYLNGNVSTFKNNQWQKVVNDELISINANNKKFKFKQFTEGDKAIRVRQDQTIFIQYANGNSLIIFCDNTKLLHKRKQNIYEIRTFNSDVKQQIIVRLTLPKNSDVNIIGHGSAFAYLGFKNLLQRSVDGFLYEVWHNKFSTYLYNQKYEYENKIYEQQIRLVYLQDGSLLKVDGNDHITYMQGDYQNSQQKLRQKWNQLYSIQQSHQVGVYDIHLNEGYIKTKDGQSNIFKINVEQQNQINISVSFKISDQDKVVNNFGNGFHIPQENFFLPVPDNSLPARVFSFDNQSNCYYQYLTEAQVHQMQVSSNIDHVEQYYTDNKTIKQYTRQIKNHDNFEQDNKVITFAKISCGKQFEIPEILLPRQSRINIGVQNNDIEFRMIERIQWNKQFKNIKRIEQLIIRQKQIREKQFNIVSY